MTYLTLFTTPKPFIDPHICMIQRNALQNWKSLGDDVQVIMVGDEEGMAEAAREFGVLHLPQVEHNRLGTPLVQSIFSLAREASDSPLLCYANADILFFPGFVNSVRQAAAQAERFLLIGQRWDLDIREPISFSGNWAERLEKRVRQQGQLHTPAGSDYFVFPRSLYQSIPDFAIGRVGWDNWMIYYGVQQGWAVIDGTPDVMVIHQNHDYSHLPGDKPSYNSKEGQANIQIARQEAGEFSGYLLLDTNRVLRNGKVQTPDWNWLRTLRQMEVALMPLEERGPRYRLARQVKRWRKRVLKARYPG